MKRDTISNLLVFLIVFILFSCKETDKSSTEYIKQITQSIDDNRLLNADQTPGDWLSYGRNYAEDRHSSLDQINKDNLDELGLAWSFNLGMRRGVETTPIVVDGIMYVTSPWSMVFAIDTRSGKQLWKYDPEVPKQTGRKACCDVVNRGVALYKGMVYVGSLDGRLIALDAADGQPVWEVLTVDTTYAYTITGAPRVVKGNVIIGNGGAEYGVRGYVTAYDAMTGEQEWRFYTVPGDPSLPFESKAMAEAAKTWTGEWWKYGGGGTAWDAMAYDPELNQLYIGVGNGAPWNRQHRSPDGGDNLYLSSIVSLNPDNGEMIWYYQTTPGDTWDYTATQHLILADLEIKGEYRKVIMQAPKNGFFYVLDRQDGSLISAEPYVYVNWAKEIDLTTGRPVENTFSRYVEQGAEVSPSVFGGHNWQPMAYNPNTNLVYVPVRERKEVFEHVIDWKYEHNRWNTGKTGKPKSEIRIDSIAPHRQGNLIAWDPVEQKGIWKVTYKDYWNGGVLSTASGLIFHGTGDGILSAYDAENGEKLWEEDLGTGIIAPPVTFLVDGKQYLAIGVGWGGAGGKERQITENIYPGTIYAFALGKNTPFPNYPKTVNKALANFEYDIDMEKIELGERLYRANCRQCHGRVARDTGGSLPDLGYIDQEVYDTFEDIVLTGTRLEKGMPYFGDRFVPEEVESIKSYILSQAAAKRQELSMR